MAAAALGTIGYLGSQWWKDKEPDTCQASLDEAYRLEKKGEPRQAQAKLTLALNACSGSQLDKAKVLDRSLQPVVRALEACDRAKRDAEVQMGEGRLKPAQKLLIAQPTKCASRPDILALRQSIDLARKTAVETIQSARNKANEGRIEEARALADEAEQLDRDNPDIASVRKTIEMKSRELAAQSAPMPSRAPSPSATPSPSPSTSPAASPSTSPSPSPSPVPSTSAPPQSAQTTQTAPSAPIATAPAAPLSLPAPMPLPSERSTLVAQILPLASAGNWPKLEALVQTLKSAIAIQPGDRRLSRAGNAEGLQLLRNGNAAGAALLFRRAWAADPSDVEVVNNLGYALMQAGQLKDALTTLEQVIAMAPDRTNAWANYSETLALTGNESGAAAALRIALRYSTDRQKSVDGFLRARDARPGSSYARVIYTVLGDMDSIPRGPVR